MPDLLDRLKAGLADRYTRIVDPQTGTDLRTRSARDGRLVAAYGVPGDPELGGWLQVWGPPVERDNWTKVELPRRVDVYDLADDGEYLYVAASGWTVFKIPLDSLPFAGSSGDN